MKKPINLDYLNIALTYGHERNENKNDTLINITNGYISTANIDDDMDIVDFLCQQDDFMPIDWDNIPLQIDLSHGVTLMRYDDRDYNNKLNVYNFCYEFCFWDDNGLPIRHGLLCYSNKIKIIDKHYFHFYFDNWVLYNPKAFDRVRQALKDVGFIFHHISRMDIAYDTNINHTAKMLSVSKRPNVDVRLLGKWLDRDEDIKDLFYMCYGSINNPLKSKSLYIKSANGGLTLCSYDKTKELNEKSPQKKEYIGDRAKANGQTYRTEIRLNGDGLFYSMCKVWGYNKTDGKRMRDQLERMTYDHLTDDRVLLRLYMETLNRLIYFRIGNDHYTLFEI